MLQGASGETTRHFASRNLPMDMAWPGSITSKISYLCQRVILVRHSGHAFIPDTNKLCPDIFYYSFAAQHQSSVLRNNKSVSLKKTSSMWPSNHNPPNSRQPKFVKYTARQDMLSLCRSVGGWISGCLNSDPKTWILTILFRLHDALKQKMPRFPDCTFLTTGCKSAA